MNLASFYRQLVCVYNTFYIGALYFSKYYIIHTLIHFYPNSIPSLSNHHNTHHIYSKYNFCVTNIWPDKIFKTEYKKIKNLTIYYKNAQTNVL